MPMIEQEFVRPSRPVADPRAAQRRSPAYIRWVQRSLNSILSTRIYVNGVMGPRVANAVRAFQARHGLPADGVVGPRTEAALIAAGAGPPPGSTPSSMARPPAAAAGRAAPAQPLVALPRNGPGYYSYSAGARQHGLQETIRAIQAIGAGWQRAQSRGPRIGIGDLSLRAGGPMPGHASHQRGLDVDMRPLRGDGREAPVRYQSPEYSRALTQRLVDLIHANGVLRVRYIFFNDPAIRGVRRWPGHDDHLHVRFYPPGRASGR